MPVFFSKIKDEKKSCDCNLGESHLTYTKVWAEPPVTYLHTRTHTYIHAHAMHTHMHACTSTCTHTNARTCVCTHTCMHTHAHDSTLIHRHTHKYTHMYIQTHVWWMKQSFPTTNFLLLHLIQCRKIFEAVQKNRMW